MPEPPDVTGRSEPPDGPEERPRGRLSRRNRERGVGPRHPRQGAGGGAPPSWPAGEPRVSWRRLDGHEPAAVRAWPEPLDAEEAAEYEALPDAAERARYAAYRAGLRHFLAGPLGPEPGAPGLTGGGGRCPRCGHRHGLTAGPFFFAAARAGDLALYALSPAPIGAALADLRDAGFDGGGVRDAGCDASDLRDGELRDAGRDTADLRDGDLHDADLRDIGAADPAAVARVRALLRRQAYDRAVPRGRCGEPANAGPHRSLRYPALPAGYAGAVIWSGAADA